MDKGESFVVALMIFVIMSYATPFPWWQDTGIVAAFGLVGMLINAREDRVW